MKLILVSDTLFKQRTKPCRTLDNDEKCLMQKESQFDCKITEPAAFGHVRIHFDKPVGNPKHSVWYVDAHHVEVQGNLPNNHPHDEVEPEGVGLPERSSYRPKTLKLPGYRHTFYLSDPVLPNGAFTWNEVTRSGTRIPITRNSVINVLSIAETLQEIQELFGDRPIFITSWYRTPKVNAEIGGASQSLHLTGGAVDFTISGVTTAEAYRRLDPWWGDRGGLAYARTFVHIDNRGYKARWTYDA